MSYLKNTFKYFLDFVVWLAIGIFALSLIASLLSGSKIFGNNNLLLVQSGSMEPAIMAGDIILISRQPQYFKNEVVTFTDSSRGIVTHRIVDITSTGGDNKLTTKGDANRSLDIDVISPNQIMGKVVLTLPKLGYLINFTRQPLGMILFIIFPAIVIILQEVAKMASLKSEK